MFHNFEKLANNGYSENHPWILQCRSKGNISGGGGTQVLEA